MSRPDLLRLSDAVLEDLTNRGTLRRARKELGAAALTVSEADDGTVTVSADDGTTCVLYANRPFAEWTCSCLAANNCRHIVRAILHYQAACSEPGVIEDEEPDSTDLPGQETPRAAAPGKVEPEAVFNPASITREHLRAALSPAALRRADQLAGQGLLAHVGSIRGISVVRIHHPTPVSVRFLAGADLNYVRCTCHDPDPCLHVAVAVAAAAGRRFGDTGLVSVAGDAWRPDASLLSEIRGAVGELVRVGAESGHRNLRGVWRRLAVRAREAELHHVADVLDELLDELARYETRSQEFTPSRLVELSAELLARAMSLANPADAGVEGPVDRSGHRARRTGRRVPVDRPFGGCPKRRSNASHETNHRQGTQALLAARGWPGLRHHHRQLGWRAGDVAGWPDVRARGFLPHQQVGGEFSRRRDGSVGGSVPGGNHH